MNTDAYKDIQQFSVELSTDYGQLKLGWEKPETIRDNEGYNIIVERIVDGEWRHVYAVKSAYTYYDATDLNAYVCQKQGFTDRQRFIVEAYDTDTIVGYAVSEEYDPRDFFPEKEELIIGKDISVDDIDCVSFTSNGTNAEDNYSYTAVKEDDDYILYYDDTKEKKISDSEWNEIIKFVKAGRIVRKTVMDPEIVVLDGGYRRYTANWEGMSESDQSYYLLKLDNDDLLNYFGKLAKGIDSIAAAGLGIAAAVGAASMLLLRKKKQK